MYQLKTFTMRFTVFTLLLFLLFQNPYSYGHCPSIRSTPAASESDFTVSFRLIAKLIVLEATVQGQKGWFIFDTGVSDLIINRTYVNDKKGITSRYYDVSGNRLKSRVSQYSFELESYFSTSCKASIIDIQHLENRLKVPILGIVGINVFSNYEVLLDYRAKKITFSYLNNQGDKINHPKTLNIPMETIPFRTIGHLPCIALKCEGDMLNFIIDTGAAINLIGHRYSSLLQESDSNKREVNVMTLGKEKVRSKRLFLPPLFSQQHHWPFMPTTAYNLNKIHKIAVRKRKFDGVLGYPFLKYQKTAINYVKREIYLWPFDDDKGHLLANQDN